MRVFFILFLCAHITYGQIEPQHSGVKIDDSLYLDAMEVSNLHWLEYEYYAKKDSSDEFYSSVLPAVHLTENYRSGYYRHPNYRHYPVVGITHAQARNFCSWRTSVVNEILSEQGVPYRVYYRLPTEKEWELASKSVDSLATIINREPTVCKLFGTANRDEMDKLFPDKEVDIKELKQECKAYKKGSRTAFILDLDYPWFVRSEEKLPLETSFDTYPKKADFIHLLGNVAELVAEPGIVKGGSWRHKLAVSFPSNQILIDPKKAYDWVGFRCVAEIISVKP
ncbi:SUMF1/EgtB/PvdO family nonheme iron enzyme [Ekhidna sp.]|uniref:formylglycine-generating enzyme family protein n=1 Tax=Ekhidna sp. TaxID=2608089 RepID=UPI003B5024DA